MASDARRCCNGRAFRNWERRPIVDERLERGSSEPNTKEEIVANSTFEASIQGIRSVWGPLSDAVVGGCKRHLADLLAAPATEDWLAALHEEAPANKELYRDPVHGFVLLAHSEYAGLYRPPHDHGQGWVIYAVQQGEIEMRTYARVLNSDGSVGLVKRDSTLMRPGQVQVYLPGDIHDTRCVKGPALLFRFTERDLKKEDKEERRVTRYVERDGVWTGATS
ncbi:hypothetical protein [Variovorax arabinosiphilus]|uniref:hypothetical protein n=1 Tax=Variovorax arabinosiphilus TaxID=3053498 RepID=UPI0025760E44|nr:MULTISPECIES: hypothetical protein [unclassified Variovorax]MDM0118710.1 hypothetical protein [Variovorax sp. J2L1-78]MDM0129135.1 hypothetical protein [Variovorax sp. J2L1-63]MDM0233078.1 hypothetical protein [Variovorax sp. J2R1-6]